MTKLNENIYWQMEGESLYDTISANGLQLKTDYYPNFLHVLNLFSKNKDSGLGEIQVATLETMRAARIYVTNSNMKTEVDFVSINSPQDTYLVPDYFIQSIELDRDVTSVSNFSINRPLPLIFDILNLVNGSSSTADVIVFTNSDICLTPSFYVVVTKLLNLGFDSIIINRRTIQGFHPESPDPIAVADIGESHPGLDCFVFPREWIDEFAGNTACVGAGQVMRGLLMNLVARAKSLLVLTQVHLTYHYGDDRLWMKKDMDEYHAHNIHEAGVTYKLLAEDPIAARKLQDLFDKFPKYKPNIS